ncbi:MAG: hypothetical protein ACLQU2_19585 [Candidatus Binataceae bacterium]
MDAHKRAALPKVLEVKHFVSFLEKSPNFAGCRIVSFEPDERPDIICLDEAGGRIGVEVTQWLMAKQKKIADQWDSILCAATKAVKVSSKINSIVFSFGSSFYFFLECDDCGDFLGRLSLSGVPGSRSKAAINSYAEYTKCPKCDSRFRDLVARRPVLEGEIQAVLSTAFSRADDGEELELVSYQVPPGTRIADDYYLQRVDIIVGQPRHFELRPFFQMGGAYAPGIAAAALTHRLNDKLTKRSYQEIKMAKGLSKTFLLVVYDDAILENTPFHGASPVKVASAAAKRWAGLFDGVFLLLYPNNPDGAIRDSFWN